jgi:hypothetical protein
LGRGGRDEAWWDILWSKKKTAQSAECSVIFLPGLLLKIPPSTHQKILWR